MKKVHTDMDAEVIAMANMPGQVRAAEQVYRNARVHWHKVRKAEFQKARRKFWSTVAVLESCILGALLGGAALLGDWIPGWFAVLLVAVFSTGVGAVSRKIREGDWYGCR